MTASRRSCLLSLFVITLAALVGIGLLAGTISQNGPTYDEPDYVTIAAQWWRTGDQERITRMGSPLTFWKLQQAPALAWLERSGRSPMLDHPENFLPELLPRLRWGAIALWLVGMLTTAAWAAWQHGPRAAMLAAWLFVLSPNLLAHGGLLTMELPLVATAAGTFFAFAVFLQTQRIRMLALSAALAGLAFSCKFTAILFPPILALAWIWERWRAGDRLGTLSRRVLLGMCLFGVLMILANLIVTAGARLPLSERQGDHPALVARLGPTVGGWIGRLSEKPWPQDAVGFLRQWEHQRNGGPSFLLGERSNHGWWYYYLVCLAVKVPLSFWLLLTARAALVPREDDQPGDRLALITMLCTILIVSIGSSRNYGYRYLLFLAPPAIVWISALARKRGLTNADPPGATGRPRPVSLGRPAPVFSAIIALGLAGQALAVASCWPYPLSYFNRIAGGPEGGARMLADSNLDWGQGAIPLARLQAETPAFRDLTLFAFTSDDPSSYGVAGDLFLVDAHGPRRPLPDLARVRTRFVGVSRSLQHGPWGPAGYFQPFRRLVPIAVTADHTIALFRENELRDAVRPEAQPLPQR